MYFDIPIWNRNQGNIRAAEANLNQSIAQRDLVRNDLLGALAERWPATTQLHSRFATHETGLLPDAERNFELVRQSYDAGQLDIIRVLQARRTLFEAKLDFLSAQKRTAAGVFEERPRTLQAESP